MWASLKIKMYNKPTLRRQTLKKIRDINEGLNSKDLSVLVDAALTPLGLVNDGLRRRVWAKLVGVDLTQLPDYRAFVLQHKDWNQVKMDVDRSNGHFEGMRKGLLVHKRQQLEDIINAILYRNPQLHYYQGFHDICAVFLIVLGNDKLAFAVAEKVALEYLREAMQKTLEPVLSQLVLIFQLLKLHDSELYNFLKSARIPSYFALSWNITWFAHDVDDVSSRARLFDAFLASPPLMPVYMAASLLIVSRRQILSFDNDSDILHNQLSKLARTSWDAEAVITQAAYLLHSFPPKSLRASPDVLSWTLQDHQKKITKKQSTVLTTLELTLIYVAISAAASYVLLSTQSPSS